MSKQKSELRLEMIKKLETLSEVEITRYSNQIEDSLFMTEIWRNSQIIGITVSRGKEINTKNIIEKAWTEGKKVAIPKCDPQEKTMDFFIFTNFNQLEEVYFGLKEPIISKTRKIEQNDIDLLIVPGICFTESGYRIGYGGGYYDRFLAQYNRGTFSLLYECQIVSDIPIETYDLPVQKLITEKRIIACYG